MSTQTTPETAYLTGPASLLAHVAYRLGFTPTDSLVTVSLRGPNSQIGVVARVDLSDVDAAAPVLAGHMRTDKADQVILVVYTDDEAAAKRAALAMRMALPTDLWGTVWHVTPTGYRSLYSAQEWRPIAEVAESTEAVRRILAGDALVACAADLLPREGAKGCRTRAARAADQWTAEGHTPGEDLALWSGATTAPVRLSVKLLGQLAAALGRITVRDALIVAMSPDSPADLPAQVADNSADANAVGAAMGALLGTSAPARPGPVADAHADVLDQVLAYVQGTAYAVPAWTLWALIQWWRGDGVRARAALVVALDTDPDYRLAHLITDALDAGLAPGWIRP
ncbi:MAG: DUF4192 family protein [Propionibacterium sp.]|nr:DUF4192 family protein [Propionibacterium sp.]